MRKIIIDKTGDIYDRFLNCSDMLDCEVIGNIYEKEEKEI